MKYIDWQKTDTTHIINAVDNLGCLHQALLFIIVFFNHPGQDGLLTRCVIRDQLDRDPVC